MKSRSYHKEIQRNSAQVLDVFDDIYIDRRTVDNVVQKLIKVPCVYGSRSRILKSLENRGNTLKIPLVCINIASITRDSRRAFDIHDGLARQHGDYDLLKNTAVPINISYALEIIGKFQEDVDQIISNFVPFFNPDIYIVVPHPISSSLKLKSQLIWDGSFALNYANEIGKNSPYRMIATTNLTLKTWMFPGMEGDIPTSGYIETISASFHAVPRPMSYDEYVENFLCGYVSAEFYDNIIISG